MQISNLEFDTLTDDEIAVFDSDGACVAVLGVTDVTYLAGYLRGWLDGQNNCT